MEKRELLLDIKNLSKHFGGLVAVNNISFHVNHGEILGLIGPNGAGKTTTFNLISGTLRPSEGSILFEGQNIVGFRPDQIAKRGIARTFQATTLFSEAKVRENVMIGFHMKATHGFWNSLVGGKNINAREKEVSRKVEEIMEFLDLAHLQNELAGGLSHGHQRRLGIAIALGTSPKLLLLDEPVTGMTQEETRGMMSLFKKLSDSGITILLVEHDMRAVMATCERLIVLNYGKKIAEGTPEKIKENEEVIRAYLGTEGIYVT